MLNQHTQLNILSYISAYLNSNNSNSISFDTNAIEAILDTGCSRTLTYDKNDFITYEPTTGEVDWLGTHKIIGKGTVKYTVMDDNGYKTDIITHKAIHVSTLDVRLFSAQQFVQENELLNAEGAIESIQLVLRWDKCVKSVSHQSESDLPIWCKNMHKLT